MHGDIKNVNYGNISAEGDVILGDVIIHLSEAAQYIDLQEKLSGLHDKSRRKEQQIATAYTKGATFLIDDLTSELESIKHEIVAVQQNIKDLKDAVIALAADFNNITINTERLRLARVYFKEGRYQEARAVFDSELELMSSELNALLSRKARLTEESVEIDAKLESKANEYMVLAELTILAFDNSSRYEQVENYLRLAISAKRTAAILFTYARFLRQQGKFDQSIIAYNNAIDEYQILNELNEGQANKELAATINSLGGLFEEIGDFTRAEETLLSSLKFCEEAASSDDADALVNLATTLSNIGTLQNRLSKLHEAEGYFSRAHAIHRRLPTVATEKFRLQLAKSNAHFASLLFKTGNYPDAKLYLSNAINLCNAEAPKNPRVYPFLATLLRDIGNIYLQTGEFQHAIESYEESINIFSQLAADNPSAFLRDFARVLAAVAHAYSVIENFVLATELYRNAITIFRKLIQQERKIYLPDLALALGNYGDHLRYKGDYQEGLQESITSFEYWEELYKNRDPAYQENISIFAASLSLAYQSVGNKPQSIYYAEFCLREAVPIGDYSEGARKSISIANEILQNWNRSQS